MRLDNETIWDVVVIGAGIQGSGVAQATAARSWSTLVLEKAERPASGTSSKSSKLIHGGLRYLETFQFQLVRECLLEKKLLCDLAPGLVEAARFVIPVYENYARAPLWVQMGLSLYKLLGWPHLNPVRGKYTKDQWKEHFLLQRKGLQAIFEYQDAQTDDAELTTAVLNSAKTLGARTRFNVNVRQVEKTADGFLISLDDDSSIGCRSLINASGPWVNEFTQLFKGASPPGMEIELVQGSHIVLDRDAMSCCYYVESPDDGRAMFVLPWKGKTLVGTTELAFKGRADECRVSPQEVKYLLNGFNAYFPSLSAGKSSILEQFAGLRVLPLEKRSNNKRSRDTVLIQENNMPGYVGIYGGKLTAYRASADKVANLLSPHLPAARYIADTKKLMLRKP